MITETKLSRFLLTNLRPFSVHSRDSKLHNNETTLFLFSPHHGLTLLFKMKTRNFWKLAWHFHGSKTTTKKTKLFFCHLGFFKQKLNPFERGLIKRTFWGGKQSLRTEQICWSILPCQAERFAVKMSVLAFQEAEIQKILKVKLWV